MAKRKNVSGKVMMNAVPSPKMVAENVAEFAAPRVMESGLSTANVFGDIGDYISPLGTAAAEDALDLRNVSNEEYALLAALGALPFAGKIGKAGYKGLQKLPPIDRSTLKHNALSNEDVGERIFDAQSRFYMPYDDPGKFVSKTSKGQKMGLGERYPKSVHTDPYYEAGVINDENVKLNNLIDSERKSGLSDAEIYKKHKERFDKYQGMLDRYQARINSPESAFLYDDAMTNYIFATPSEEINVMRNLGLKDKVDPRMADIMDKTREHYDSLIDRIYNYNSTFPKAAGAKLTSTQFKKLKDMGIKPEEIDAFLAQNPEFLMLQ